MKNPFKEHIIELFKRIIELRHHSNRINLVLKKDAEKYTKEGAQFYSGSSLIISDWTGPTDNGWEINFHTGISKFTEKEDYSNEIEKIISRECCLAFAQSFEALEKFLKDCAFEIMKKDGNDPIREKIYGGDQIYKYIRKSCGEEFLNFSKENNKNIHFKEFWTTISETRHAIVHSSCRLKNDKVSKSRDHFATFEYLFDYEKLGDDKLLIKLSYRQLDKILKHVAEFAYQIFKLISLRENLEHKLR